MADNDNKPAQSERKQPAAASEPVAKPATVAKTGVRISVEHKKAWARLDARGAPKK
jgi:hypothetical protein